MCRRVSGRSLVVRCWLFASWADNRGHRRRFGCFTSAGSVVALCLWSLNLPRVSIDDLWNRWGGFYFLLHHENQILFCDWKHRLAHVINVDGLWWSKQRISRWFCHIFLNNILHNIIMAACLMRAVVLIHSSSNRNGQKPLVGFVYYAGSFGFIGPGLQISASEAAAPLWSAADGRRSIPDDAISTWSTTQYRNTQCLWLSKLYDIALCCVGQWLCSLCTNVPHPAALYRLLHTQILRTKYCLHNDNASVTCFLGGAMFTRNAISVQPVSELKLAH